MLKTIDNTITSICKVIQQDCESGHTSIELVETTKALAELINARTQAADLERQVQSQPKEVSEESVRVPIANIRILDPYEQMKFEKLKTSDLNSVICYLEEVLKGQTISLHY